MIEHYWQDHIKRRGSIEIGICKLFTGGPFKAKMLVNARQY
jgi:hypothetical protein